MRDIQYLHALWQLCGLPSEALNFVQLSGGDPVFPSSFAVGSAAQLSIAAAALAACELSYVRGGARQKVAVDTLHAAVECSGWFSLDGREPNLWDAFSGLYRCADGYVRIHANFAHHREGALRLLGLSPATTQRTEAEQAMLRWRALDLEQAAAERGLVATALRSFDQWDATAQGQAILAKPLMTLSRIGDAEPLELPSLAHDERPLSGVRVLDLTRILAGPVGGRALAAQGADVLLINSPNLPNIEAIADTSRGKRSALLDLHTEQDRAALWRLIDGAHVFSQGYRPGGLAALGYSPEALAERRPGIVYVSLTAYGTEGPWAGRRGFDSLVQTAMGFNHGEGESAGEGIPRALPMQILDQATGYLMAYGTAAALYRQQTEGGSWHVQVSLAQTGQWLRSLGRIPNGFSLDKPSVDPWLETSTSGFGQLHAVRPSAQLERTQPRYRLPSMPPGSAEPVWL
ncbi:CoA transferase [Pseudomonas sp. CCI3.2]|uniref:CoA transferase n=1 Tax=unclassified Pseudomonas TaxID=196821 RepID=UPI002AC8FE0A|nr:MULTISPECIES: CoA transferase [unclassified Pseudomonas]MEB0077673.1 CoA transferase [Pseudomonas sp. MH10out]MEB0093891.1 CoA transferase [Pseudomonas sp. CCI4.2]MEB0101333.1 CoA transferase [Pseudomonas sp. CCI3.2]MEB0131440.1 CoA transferase [Pseudomonas sp. CCI2.4]MEB0158450.1 CoA transferase [Pseudomonas sp. AH2 (2023)]